MKKLVQINVVCNGSTGKIMNDLSVEAEKNGYMTYCFFGRGKKNKNVNSFKIDTKLEVYFHIFLARLGFNGHGSYFATKRLVKKLKKINPDVIHLHNIHGYYLNFKVLFKYLKEFKGKIVWTLHDCWSFTGHCAYFTISGCKKWKKGCHNCSSLKSYPKEILDTTRREYLLKKELFSGLNNLTLVTPSNWLKELVSMSFLKKYPIKVINNGIDLNIFKPIYDENIYKKYNISKDKKIILGIANIWEDRKGLNDFLELSKLIDDNTQIVLVGVNENIKKKLPSNIIGIERTENQLELAKIYTIADVFFNPTYEDNYPTTNLESLACNTPVVCYNTGGCFESTLKMGFVIDKKDYNSLIEYVLKLKKEKYKLDKKMLDKNYLFETYIKLYELG